MAPVVGRIIAGKGIPLGSTITAFDSTTVTISANTTSANQNSPATTTISSADAAEAPINDISSNQFQQLMIGGGRLAMFTGNSAGNTVGVYCFGRNADSGTRISVLGESYRGVTQNPGAHMLPTFAGSSNGAGGNPGLLLTALEKWKSETVLGQGYAPGAGGFNSGGDLADGLTVAGCLNVTPTGITKGPGWIIGYLGRSDASRACQKTYGQNTAKRLTFNGQKDWSGLGSANNVDGSPADGFVDSAVTQGLYQAWEYEHFFRRSTLGATDDQTKVLNALATSILAASAPSGSISLSSMGVTRSVEGGAIAY